MINKNNTPLIQKSCFAIAALTLSLSASVHALNEEVEKPTKPIEYSISQSSIVTVPVVENALVFANLTDEMPAVVNYFTKESESDIIKFYEQSYGEIVHRENKYGRLTLTFKTEVNTIRVAITQQNNKRQVDIIVEVIN
ncbi:MAG: hypothetical protein ACPGTQ_05160 [Colwellia sp.]